MKGSHVPASDLSAQQNWSLVECVRVLKRRRETLAYIALIGAVVAGLLTLAQPRMYQSVASLEIQPVNDNFLNIGDVYPATALSSGDWSGYVQTQAEILQQDALLERVVRTLRLKDRPEFHGHAGSQATHQQDIDPLPVVRNAVSALKRNLRIVPSHGSHVIQIVCDARDAQLAARITNTLAQLFIEESVRSRQLTALQTYDALSVQLAVLRDRLADSENRLADSERPGGNMFRSSQAGERIRALKRELEVNRRSYEVISQRADDARIASGVRQSNIRLLGAAQPATQPYKPNLQLNLVLGIVGALIFGIGVVMFQEQSNPTVRSPGEAAISLALPELGVIPHLRGRRLSRLALNHPGSGKGGSDDLMRDRSSHISEAFRATLASILSPDLCADHPRILMVTSSWPMEGKTTIVSNLGVSLTEIGRKVLLVDGDMRRPRLHKIFDRANSWGLSDILREQNAVEDLPLDVLVTKTAIPGLFLLPSGASATNITALLWSDRMARLLPRFRKVFDHVLVDAPPCLEFADARIMARFADQLVLVVRANYTDRRAAQAAVHRLSMDDISVRGVILNCCDPERNGLYHYANYGFMR